MTGYLKTKKNVLVVEEIKRWVQGALSTPSKHFNDMPACPYAKSALINSRVNVFFGGKEEVLRVCDNWETEGSDICIVVVDSSCGDAEGAEDIIAWCEDQNDLLKFENLTLMPFVPGHSIETGQPEEEMTNWEPLTEEEYSMIFVQPLTDLETASTYLMSKGYYKNCTSQFMEYIQKRSERATYAWKQEDEEASEENEVASKPTPPKEEKEEVNSNE